MNWLVGLLCLKGLDLLAEASLFILLALRSTCSRNFFLKWFTFIYLFLTFLSLSGCWKSCWISSRAVCIFSSLVSILLLFSPSKDKPIFFTVPKEWYTAPSISANYCTARTLLKLWLHCYYMNNVYWFIKRIHTHTKCLSFVIIEKEAWVCVNLWVEINAYIHVQMYIVQYETQV